MTNATTQEFSLTLEDYNTLRKIIQKKGGQVSTLIPLVGLVFVIVGCISWLNTVEGAVSVWQAIILGMVVIGTFYVYRRYTSQKLAECERSQFERTTLGDPLKLAISDDNLVLERKHHKSIWEWNAFNEVTMEGNAILLWYSTLEAIIVPAHVFDEDGKREAFFADLKSRIS